MTLPSQLDDEDDHAASGGFSQSVFTSPGSPPNPFASQNTAAFVCQVCGHTETELGMQEPDICRGLSLVLQSTNPPFRFLLSADETTGRQVCTNCFTQSQQVLTQEQTELDLEEVMGLAAKSKVGGRVLKNTRTSMGAEGSGKPGDHRLQGRPKHDIEQLNTAQPLPSLELCLHGFQCVLHRSTVCVAKLIKRDFPHLVTEFTTRELREKLLEIVKHLWFAYLRSWHLGAQHYGKQQPTLRLSFRDFFLPNKYKSLLPKVMAHNFLSQQKGDRRFGNDEDHEEDAYEFDNDVESPLAVTLAEPVPLHARSATLPKHNKPSRRRKPFLFGELLYQLTIYHTYTETKGCREAALLLKPTLGLVVSILHVATLRLGLAPHQLLLWLRKGDWPLWNAYASPKALLPSNLRDSLYLVQSFFRLSSWPTMAQLQQEGQLLLLAAGVESEASWRELHGSGGRALPADNDDSNDAFIRAMPSMIPVTSIPSLLAQSVADLGLDNRVLHTCLGLAGLYQSSGDAGVLIPAEQITQMAQLVALLVCAIVLAQNPTATVFQRQSKGAQIPWDECSFARLDQGSVKAYVDFYTAFSAPISSVAPEFTSLLQGQEKESNDGGGGHVDDSDDNDSIVASNRTTNNGNKRPPHGRLCPVVYLGASSTDEIKHFPLRNLVYGALRHDKWKAKEWPTLLPVENLLIEFTSFAHCLSSREVRRALESLLIDPKGGKRERKRKRQKEVETNNTVKTDTFDVALLPSVDHDSFSLPSDVLTAV